MKGKRVFVDYAILVLLVFMVVGPRLSGLIFLGIICSIAPDALTITALYFKVGWLRKYADWHKAIQSVRPDWTGIATQVVYIMCMLVVVYFLAR